MNQDYYKWLVQMIYDQDWKFVTVDRVAREFLISKDEASDMIDRLVDEEFCIEKYIHSGGMDGTYAIPNPAMRHRRPD